MWRVWFLVRVGYHSNPSLPLQVVGVELLGYRKRLQYGIAELRRAHPSWHDGMSKTSPKKSPSPQRAVRLLANG